MSNIPNFASNKKCWRLINKLVFGEEVSCPLCGCELQENYLSRYLWCKICRKKLRATAWHGSWLYGMKLSSKQLFKLIWCWQNRKSVEAAILFAGVSYPTVARWFSRFRENLPDAATMLEGLIQADESYFSKLKSKQATYIVTGAIEQDTGRLALRITGGFHDGRSQDVLEQFIQDSVKPGSLIITDKWYGYDELPLLGYEHESHNHSRGDFANTNKAELIWSVAKRHMRKLYGQRILTHQLEELCKEWMARANRPKLFEDPMTYLRFTLDIPG